MLDRWNRFKDSKDFFHPANRRLLYEELTDAAVDPYAAVKDVYIQYRAKKVRE